MSLIVARVFDSDCSGVFVQNDGEKCLVDLDLAIVLDETHLSELVHE
jgi:hypothetical protein